MVTNVRAPCGMTSTVVNAIAVLAVILSLGVGSAVGSPLPGRDTGSVGAGVSLAAATVGFPGMALTAETVAALPEARYDAVIDGLIGYSASVVPSDMGVAYTVSSDTPIYGQDRLLPVARLNEFNFLGEKSVVVVVSFFEGWALVLTPARQSTPSATSGVAPAQTAGWVHADVLAIAHLAPDRIVVSVGEQSLTIIDGAGVQTAAFAIGVGTPETPTPTGVTGYLHPLLPRQQRSGVAWMPPPARDGDRRRQPAPARHAHHDHAVSVTGARRCRCRISPAWPGRAR